MEMESIKSTFLVKTLKYLHTFPTGYRGDLNILVKQLEYFWGIKIQK